MKNPERHPVAIALRRQRGVDQVASGASTATNGVRYAIGKAPAATANSSFLPPNWVEYVMVPSGMQLSSLGNDSTTGTLSVTEIG